VFSKSTHDRNERIIEEEKKKRKRRKKATNHLACFPADPIKNDEETGKMERDIRRDQS